jgi:hypothetical protein
MSAMGNLLRIPPRCDQRRGDDGAAPFDLRERLARRASGKGALNQGVCAGNPVIQGDEFFLQLLYYFPPSGS